MDTNSEDVDILKYPILMLSIIGLYSRTNGRKIVLFATIYLVMLTFILSTLFFQFVDFRGDVFQFVSNMEGCVGYMQHFGKVVLMVSQQSKLRILLSYEKYCWKTSSCSKRIKDQLDYLTTITVRLQVIFFVCMTTAVLILYLSPLFGQSLPLGMWLKEEYKLLHKISLFTQVAVAPFMGTLLLGIDTTIISFCAKLIIQFRILGSHMKELSLSTGITPNEYKNKMKSYIEQHIFLLQFTRTLQEMLSFVMVVEYVTTAPLICSEMYVAFESDNAATIARYAILSLVVTLQLAFYCIPVDYIASEAMKIGEHLYSSDWFADYNRVCQQPIPFIIHRSQQMINFRGAGIIEVNSRSLLTVLKLCWSTCTVLRGIKQRN